MSESTAIMIIAVPTFIGSPCMGLCQRLLHCIPTPWTENKERQHEMTTLEALETHKPSNRVMYIIPKQNEVDIEKQVITLCRKFISFSSVIATMNGRKEAR